MNLVSRIRKHTDSIIVKAILVLIGASMLFFGVSSGIMGGGAMSALKVGDRQIGVQEVDREFRRQVLQMQSVVGQFDVNQAVRMGFLDQALDNMVFRILLDIEAENLGLFITDDKVFDIIKNMQEFKDEHGNFSAEVFSMLLRNAGETEANFVEELRRQNARELLMNSIVTNLNVKNIAWLLFARANETRVVDIVQLRYDMEKIAEKPTDEELSGLYSQAKDRFMEPEWREISYFVIDAPMIVKVKGLDAKDTDRVYRTMREAAENIIDEFNGGAGKDDIAKAFGVKVVLSGTMNAQGVKRDGKQVSDAGLSQKMRDIAFFALNENSISNVIENGERLNMVIVGKVEAAAPKPFEEVRDEVLKLWTRQRQVAAARGKSERIVSIIRDGADSAQAVVSVEKGAIFTPNQKVTRSTSTLPQEVVSQIFSAKVMEPVRMSSDSGDYVALVRSSVMPSEQGGDFVTFFELNRRRIIGDIFDEYIQYLAGKHGVKKNMDILSRMYR